MTRLSILLPALGGLESVRGALGAWEAQSRRGELELLVLCADPGAGGRATPGLRVVDCSGLRLHEARARGVREAASDFVFLAEDHCVPDEGWAETFLAMLDGGWDAIGCCLRPGRATDARAQATFLLAYGEWMPPIESGRVSTLPGHNLALRRQVLLELGDELEELLVVSAFLVRRVGRAGRLAVDARATMRHFDVTALRDQVRVFEAVGRSFGAIRTRHRPVAVRAAYALLLPVVAAAHWRRALTQFRRAGRTNGMRPACLAPAALFAGVWAWGEAVGAVAGPGRVVASAWTSETKPVPPDRLDAEA